MGDEREELPMSNLVLEYLKSLPVAEKTIRAISASQRVESSWAFLKSPLLLFENVTCRAAVLAIFLISILCLVILFPLHSIKNKQTTAIDLLKEHLCSKESQFEKSIVLNMNPMLIATNKHMNKMGFTHTKSNPIYTCM